MLQIPAQILIMGRNRDKAKEHVDDLGQMIYRQLKILALQGAGRTFTGHCKLLKKQTVKEISTIYRLPSLKPQVHFAP